MPPIGRTWNYTGRKKGGPTLGQSIGRDLRKDAQLFRSKVNNKSLKELDPDKGPESRSLDLIVRGKGVSDEGLQEIVEGLEEALQVEDGYSSRKLEELDLSENGLTSTSLRGLVPIIRHAAYDIRDIDLSRNNIAITTTEDAENWEEFLLSFGSCRVLRRIDFSQNNMSNHIVFEILLRVYCRHIPADPDVLRSNSRMADSKTNRTNSQTSLSLDLGNVSLTDLISESDRGSTFLSTSLSDATILKRRRGLRSIPYIIFNNVGMSDTGALYLSYILESHFFPQYLQETVGSSTNDVVAEEKYQSNYPFGISYEFNHVLSQHGVRILELAKAVRASAFGDYDNVSLRTREMYNIVDGKHLHGSRRGSNASGQEGPRRRLSGLSSESWDELESFRKKIQKATIEDCGIKSVHIWSSALRMLVLARVILPPSRSPSSPLGRYSRITSPLRHMKLPSLMENVEHHSSVSNGTQNGTNPHLVEPRARLQSSHHVPGKGKTAFRQKISNFIVKLKGGKHLDAYHKYDRELPEFIWKRILAYASDSHGVLSDAQQDAVVSFARDWANLKPENQLLSKQRSVQIWSVLETMGCLTYDMVT